MENVHWLSKVVKLNSLITQTLLNYANLYQINVYPYHHKVHASQPNENSLSLNNIAKLPPRRKLREKKVIECLQFLFRQLSMKCHKKNCIQHWKMIFLVKPSSFFSYRQTLSSSMQHVQWIAFENQQSPIY